MFTFGLVHFGRLPTEQQRHQSLLQQLRKIMATQAEIVAQLKTANDQLKASNDRLSAVNATVLKIGTETDKLKDQIANLPLNDASPDLIAAVAELKTTSDAQSALVDTLQASATAGDEKVPD
jgi:predicted  nucleic acid-binding Zn-ribbon protein